MNYAIVGLGRMGRAIDAAARDRGHRRVAVVDPAARGRGVARSIEPSRLDGVDVAFEFTVPESAEANVVALLRAGVPVVCGTTGWTPGRAVRAAARDGDAAAVVAPNFSVGMNLFYRVVREAARRYGAIGLHRPYVWEHHHDGKVDAPGGTALALAETVRRADPRRPAIVAGAFEGRLPDGALHVAAVRAGHEPGTHVVGFDGPYDAVRLEHRARGREGFAAGAVLAAEWLTAERRDGVHAFGAVLDELVRRREART